MDAGDATHSSPADTDEMYDFVSVHRYEYTFSESVSGYERGIDQQIVILL